MKRVIKASSSSNTRYVVTFGPRGAMHSETFKTELEMIEFVTGNSFLEECQIRKIEDVDYLSVNTVTYEDLRPSAREVNGISSEAAGQLINDYYTPIGE